MKARGDGTRNVLRLVSWAARVCPVPRQGYGKARTWGSRGGEVVSWQLQLGAREYQGGGFWDRAQCRDGGAGGAGPTIPPLLVGPEGGGLLSVVGMT